MGSRSSPSFLGMQQLLCVPPPSSSSFSFSLAADPAYGLLQSEAGAGGG